jgi:hypothetical protein
MWEAIATQAAGSIGDALIGKIFGGGSSKSKGRSALEQQETALDTQKKAARDIPEFMVEGAKRAGLHPLAVLGMQPAAGSTIYENIREDVGSNLGQNLGRAIAANYKGAKAERLEDLAIRNAELRNDLLEAQITEINNPQNNGLGALPADNHEAEIVRPEQFTTKKGDQGTIAGKHAMMKDYSAGSGMTVNAPYSEEGITEALEGSPLWYKYPKWAEIVIKRAAAKFSQGGVYSSLKGYNRKMALKREAAKVKRALKAKKNPMQYKGRTK